MRSKSSELLSIRYIKYFCCISVNAVFDGDCRLSLSVALRGVSVEMVENQMNL